MPEGPEIRRAAEQVAAAVAGRTAIRVLFTLPRLGPHGPRLSGRRVEAVESRGKALLVHFAGGDSIYTHNQLYGRWYVVAPGRPPATGRELRLAIHTRSKWALLYSASDIAVLPRARLGEHRYLARLGVELLKRGTRLRTVRAALDAPRFARRSLAALLLDQSFLAGIGNYLRSEILFAARLAPHSRLATLSPGDRDRLASAALALTRRAYRTGGITNDPARAARLKRQGLPFAAYRHQVFGRDGQSCWQCGTAITREQAAGRNLYACPRCQRRHD
ncbi:MAG TPA: endonuclease VIII [Steroidobacteraceae bacterium]|nr:endonuclease VIII [Steroidobacteraceae bacterium]